MYNFVFPPPACFEVCVQSFASVRVKVWTTCERRCVTFMLEKHWNEVNKFFWCYVSICSFFLANNSSWMNCLTCFLNSEGPAFEISFETLFVSRTFHVVFVLVFFDNVSRYKLSAVIPSTHQLFTIEYKTDFKKVYFIENRLSPGKKKKLKRKLNSRSIKRECVRAAARNNLTTLTETEQLLMLEHILEK